MEVYWDASAYRLYCMMHLMNVNISWCILWASP